MKARLSGFTLLELIVTVAVVAILAGVALPGFASLRDRLQADATSHALTASLAAARIAAVTHRHPVSICPSADGLRCGAAGDWSRGWIVFRDPTRALQPATVDAIVQRGDAPGPAYRLTGSRGRALVRYQPDGRASGTNISFHLCSDDGRRLLASVIVSNSGRARRERPRGAAPCPAAPPAT